LTGKLVQCHCYPDNLYELAPRHDGDRLTCKFILVESPESLHFVAGPITQFKYHATLADKFCAQLKLPYAWVHKPDQGQIYDKRYKIRGGGVLTVDRSAGLVRVFGVSRAYGPYKTEEVRRALEVCPHLNVLTLVIDG